MLPAMQIFLSFLVHAYGSTLIREANDPTNSIPSILFSPDSSAKYGMLVVDGSWKLLWPCLIPWLMFETSMGYAWLHHIDRKLSCHASVFEHCTLQMHVI